MRNLLRRLKLLLPKYKLERKVFKQGYCSREEYDRLKIVR